MFADKLKELRERATEGTWYVDECKRPDGHALAWLGNVLIETDAKKIKGTRYKDPKDDAELIAYLANHAEQIEALVRAAMEIHETGVGQYDYEDSCCQALANLRLALAALDKEQS